ncbi:MAG: hypothetical protein WBI40_00165 [Methylococcaceae bacterium]
MTEQIEVKPKNKGGRPKGAVKDKKGEYLWIPANYVDQMKAFFEALKIQQQKQVQQ